MSEGDKTVNNTNNGALLLTCSVSTVVGSAKMLSV